MAKFVEVKLGCGYAALGECDEIGTQGDGTVTSMELTVDGNGREIQLCKRHREDLTNLLSMLMEDGQPLPVKKKSTKKSTVAPANGQSKSDEPVAVQLDCKAPSKDDPSTVCGREFKNNAGLAQHVTRSHGFKNLVGYMEKHPESALS